MPYRLRKQPGQVVVLMALVLVVLLAFVGLAIDVGNAYGEQRQDQAGATSSALEAMEAYLRGTVGKPAQSSDLYDAVNTALQQNEIEAGTYEIVAPNTWGSANIAVWVEFLGQNGGVLSDLTDFSGPVESNATYIRVTVNQHVETYFARVVGRETLTVNANAYATICAPSEGVYPVTFDVNLLSSIKPDPKGGPGAEFWAYSDKDSGHFGWLDWDGGSNAGGQLDASWSGPGTLSGGFVEGDHQAAVGPAATYLNGSMDLDSDNNASTPGGGDWMWPQTGAVSQISDELDWHINHDNLPTKGFVESDTDWTVLTLPLHSQYNSYYGQPSCKPNTGGTTGTACDPLPTYGIWGDDDKTVGGSSGANPSNYQYKLVAFASFRLVRYNLEDSGGPHDRGKTTPCNGNNYAGRGYCLRYLQNIDRGRACTGAGAATGAPPQQAPVASTPVPMSCQNNPLRDAQHYNQFIFGDLTYTGDSQGQVAVGGDAKLTGSDINTGRVGSPGLVVDGQLTYTADGKVYNGVVYGSLANNTKWGGPADPSPPKTFTVQSGVAVQGSPPFSFPDAVTYLTDGSTIWSQVQANGDTDSQSTLRFTGTDTSLDVHVFGVTAGALATATSINITVPPNPSGTPRTVLINVSGTTVTFPNISSGTFVVNGTTPAYVIFNAYQATDLDITGSVQGSILAPLATASSGGGGIAGSLITAEHNGSAPIGRDYFQGCLPLP